jgi:hypothetical protein
LFKFNKEHTFTSTGSGDLDLIEFILALIFQRAELMLYTEFRGAGKVGQVKETHKNKEMAGRDSTWRCISLGWRVLIRGNWPGRGVLLVACSYLFLGRESKQNINSLVKI